MSPALSELPERASSRLAHIVFLMIWAVSLLPVLLLAGVGYSLFGAQLRLAPADSVRLMIAAAGGVAALMGILAWFLGQRFVGPVHDLIATMKQFVEGDWEQRSPTERQDEFGELAHLFNQIAGEMKEAYNLLSLRGTDEQDTSRRQSLLMLAQIFEDAPNLSELHREALELIVRQYRCNFAALYLIERTEPVGASYAVLTSTAGNLDSLPAKTIRRINETRINLDMTPTMEWLVSKSFASRRVQIGQVEPQPAGGDLGLAEATLPLIRRLGTGEERLIGILDLYAANRVRDSRLGPFSSRAMSELQAMSNLLALASLGMATVPAGPASAATGAATPGSEKTPATGGEIPSTPLKTGAAESLAGALAATPSLLPLAGAGLEAIFAASRKIAQANTQDEVLRSVGEALRSSPFLNAFVVQTGVLEGSHSEGPGLPRFEVFDCRGEPTSMREEGQPDLAIAPLEDFFVRHQGQMVIVEDIGKRLQEAITGETPIFTGIEPPASAPLGLLQVAQRIGSEAAAFLPDLRGEHLMGVLVVGRPPRPALRNLQSPPLNPALLDPYINLVHLAATAMERVRTQGHTQRRLAELETVWNVSQTIAGATGAQTTLEAIYPVLHRQVETVMGTISSFAILLYDGETNIVQVPYMMEEGTALDIPPFSLSENTLSGHVIRTRQPLRIHSLQEMEEVSARIGSKKFGQEALSWLGVPMLFGGEVLGIIIVQDIRHEHRFDEEDQRLLTTLALQAAVVVRNTRLLEASRRQVEQAQMINEITARIRRAPDIQGIIQTTVKELGLALGARRASIRIASRQENSGNSPGSHLEESSEPAAPVAEAEL